MVTTVSVYEFRDWFLQSATYKNNFSYDGLTALFDYLEDYEDNVGEQVEFDPIAIAVEYTEYKNLAKLQENYTDIKSLEDLQDETTVIEFGDGQLIIADF